MPALALFVRAIRVQNYLALFADVWLDWLAECLPALSPLLWALSEEGPPAAGLGLSPFLLPPVSGRECAVKLYSHRLQV